MRRKKEIVSNSTKPPRQVSISLIHDINETNIEKKKNYRNVNSNERKTKPRKIFL
jgi:hypothetical protein